MRENHLDKFKFQSFFQMFQENDQMFLFENTNFLFDNGSQKYEFCLNPVSNQDENFMFFEDLSKHNNIQPQKECTIKQEINPPIISKGKNEDIGKNQMKYSEEKLQNPELNCNNKNNIMSLNTNNPNNTILSLKKETLKNEDSRISLNKKKFENFSSHSIENQKNNTKNCNENFETLAKQNINLKNLERTILNEICINDNDNENSKCLIEKKEVIEIHHSKRPNIADNQKNETIEIDHSKTPNIADNDIAIKKETSKKKNFLSSINPSHKNNFDKMSSSSIRNENLFKKNFKNDFESTVLKENNLVETKKVIGGTLSKMPIKTENDIPKKKETFRNEDFSYSQISTNENYDSFSRHSIINKNFFTSILKENNEKNEVVAGKQSKIQNNNHKTLSFRLKDKPPHEKKVTFDRNEALERENLTKKNEYCINNEPKKMGANFCFGLIQKLEKIEEEEEPKNLKKDKKHPEINQKMNFNSNDQIKTIYPNKNVKDLGNESKKTLENLVIDSKNQIECSNENKILVQTIDSNTKTVYTDPNFTKKEQQTKTIYPFKKFKNNNEFTNDNQNQEKKEEKIPKVFSFEPKKFLNNSFGNLNESFQHQKLLENNGKKLPIKNVDNFNAIKIQQQIENADKQTDDDVLKNKNKTDKNYINLEFKEEILQNFERKNSNDDQLLRNEQNNKSNKAVDQISKMFSSIQKDHIKTEFLFNQQSKI